MSSKKMLYISTAIMAAVVIAYNLVARMFFSNDLDYGQNAAKRQEETFLNKMRQRQEELKNQRPMPKTNIDRKETFETESIKIIKEKDFMEVAEKPKSPMQKLIEMAQGKNKTSVYIDEKDLNKKINLYEKVSADQKLQAAEVPQPGEEAKSRLTRISAPVTYKIFKEENSWKEFLKTHKVREIKTDFSKNDVLILVSNSELPNGIFIADSVKTMKDISIVYYKVNPLEMSTMSETKMQHHFSAINIPKKTNVKLEQID